MRAVAVKQLPETLNSRNGRLFLRELESFMNVDRPCIVFDCSKLHQIDRPAIHLLLCCLEEAMKRKGDVKLARIPARAKAMLELTGAIHLFEVFDTNADAVSSFRRHPLLAASAAEVPGGSRRTFDDAA
jgi:anti-anti-sigma regulatory factor